MASPAWAGRRAGRSFLDFCLLALFALTNGQRALAQDGPTKIGQRVVTRFGAVLRVGNRIVDDEKLENSPSGRLRNLSRIYCVTRTNGAWLFIEDEKSGAAGWVSSDWVIPFDAAIEYFTDEIAFNPDNAAAYNRRGHIWRDMKEYDLAISDYGEAIRLEPTNEVGWCSRGLAWFQKKDLDHAIADFSKAIRIDRRYAAAYYNRGIAWFEKKEYDRAIVDYDAAVRVDPKYALAYNNRGVAWRAKKDYDKAIADFDAAIRIDPKSSFAYVNR
jgi:Tetratricopeptide repeat